MRLRAVEQRPALSHGHWPTRYAVVRAAVQRKWTKTVVSASGGSMGVEFVESRAACGCCYAPIESSPSTECRPVSLTRLGCRLTHYHALSTRRMGRATQVLCAHLRCYRSCSRRNDAATRSAVAVLSMQPAQVSPEETRAAASPATGPFTASASCDMDGHGRVIGLLGLMTTVLAERRKRASRARIAGADGKSATFSPCSERIHHLHPQQRQVASHLAAALALQHLTSHRNRSTRLCRSSDIESAHEASRARSEATVA